MDLCVNGNITGFGLSENDFVYYKYTCNDDGTAVTRTNYGSNPNCSGDSAESTTVYSDTSLVAGVLNSFDCTGDDDYAQTHTFKLLSLLHPPYPPSTANLNMHRYFVNWNLQIHGQDKWGLLYSGRKYWRH